MHIHFKYKKINAVSQEAYLLKVAVDAYFYCVVPFTIMGLISATLKIVVLISLNLFVLLYEVDPPPRPNSRYATARTTL